MRLVAMVAAAVLLIAGCACEISAREYSKARGRHTRHPLPHVDREPSYPNAYGWYPHDANKLPFGSAIWWDQMRREGRLGGSH